MINFKKQRIAFVLGFLSLLVLGTTAYVASSMINDAQLRKLSNEVVNGHAIVSSKAFIAKNYPGERNWNTLIVYSPVAQSSSIKLTSGCYVITCPRRGFSDDVIFGFDKKARLSLPVNLDALFPSYVSVYRYSGGSFKLIDEDEVAFVEVR